MITIGNCCKVPVYIKNTNIMNKHTTNEYNYLTVPCGKCYDCRKKRSQGWAFRLTQELVNHEHRYFVTLTYSDENLTYGNTLPTLVKQDLVKYFKRLRKKTFNKIKYYAVGEYGTQLNRPHYHIILFGAKPQLICDSWTIKDIPIGMVDIGEVTPASIRYVTNYVVKATKKINGVEPEFSLMSKGLGLSYLNNKHMIDFYKKNLHPYITDLDGKKIPMPRYYRDKLYSENDKKIMSKNADKHFYSKEEVHHQIKKGVVERNERDMNKLLLKR